MGYAYTYVYPKGTDMSKIDLSKFYDLLNLQSLPGELWRPIDEFAGSYEVSNKGRVRSLPRCKLDKIGRVCVQLGCILSLLNGDKHTAKLRKNVILRKHGRMYNRQVHRLVACAFVPNPDATRYTQVNHIDGDPSNNDAANLEWVTAKQNVRHAIITGLIQPRRYPGMNGYREGETYNYKALQLADYHETGE